MRLKLISVLCIVFMVTGMFTFNAYAGNGCDDGIASWFPFDETSGTTAFDMVGPENGQYVNGPRQVEGKIGNGLELGGGNEHVVVADNPAVNFGTGDFSIVSWINIEAYGGGTLLTKRHFHNSPGYLFVAGGGSLLLQMTDDVHGWYNFYAYRVLAGLSGWHHVAVTVDRDQADGGKMYVDGEVVYTFNPVGRNGNMDTDADLHIGRQDSGYFRGTIDELALYKKALSAEQIADVMVGERQDISDYSLFATNSIYMRTGTVVNGGNIGVSNVSVGPWLDGASEVALSHNVFLADGVSVYGDKVYIKPESSVDNVYCNVLTNYGTVRGNITDSLELPLNIVLPVFPTPQPGLDDVVLTERETLTLDAGSYGEVLLDRGAILFLSGGTYHFENLNVADYAEVRFLAAAEVVINNRLESGKNIKIGSMEGAGVNADDIVFFVNGINGVSGTLNETPKAVTIGIRHALQANIYAPNGTLWLKARGQSEGAFIAKDIMVEYYVQLTLNSAF
ncbi:MAG: LamG domain-containing protein [bacterium]|nr:LamG domain-containing protein [bacterium]